MGLVLISRLVQILSIGDRFVATKSSFGIRRLTLLLYQRQKRRRGGVVYKQRNRPVYRALWRTGVQSLRLVILAVSIDPNSPTEHPEVSSPNGSPGRTASRDVLSVLPVTVESTRFDSQVSTSCLLPSSASFSFRSGLYGFGTDYRNPIRKRQA